MKALITGADGQLGQAIVRAWSDDMVIGLDHHQLDITRPLDIKRSLELYQPQVVINCATWTSAQHDAAIPTQAAMVNGTAVGYVAKACDILKIPVVHFSCAEVFSGQRLDGYDERAQPDAVTDLGRSKAHGEQQLFMNTQRAYCVRAGWLWNPEQLMDQLMTLADHLAITSITSLQPTSVDDVAQFTRSLVLDRAPYGFYHSINEGYASSDEILALVGRPANSNQSEETSGPGRLRNTKRPPLPAWSAAIKRVTE